MIELWLLVVGALAGFILFVAVGPALLPILGAIILSPIVLAIAIPAFIAIGIYTLVTTPFKDWFESKSDTSKFNIKAEKDLLKWYQQSKNKNDQTTLLFRVLLVLAIITGAAGLATILSITGPVVATFTLLPVVFISFFTFTMLAMFIGSEVNTWKINRSVRKQKEKIAKNTKIEKIAKNTNLSNTSISTNSYGKKEPLPLPSFSNKTGSAKLKTRTSQTKKPATSQTEKPATSQNNKPKLAPAKKRV